MAKAGRWTSGLRTPRRARAALDLRSFLDRSPEVSGIAALGSSAHGDVPSAAATLRRAGAVAACALLVALAGCSADPQDSAMVAHLLRARAESCQRSAASIMQAWRASIGTSISIDDAVRGAMGSEAFRTHSKKSLAYDARFQVIFARIRGRLSEEVLGTVVDLQSDVEALCKLSLDPGGYSLMNYGAKIVDLRSDIDRSASKVDTRIGATIGAAKARDIDLAVAAEVAQ